MWPTSFPAALSFIRVIRAIRGQKLLNSSGLLVRRDGVVARPSAREKRRKNESSVGSRQASAIFTENRQLNTENSASRRRGRFGS